MNCAECASSFAPSSRNQLVCSKACRKERERGLRMRRDLYAETESNLPPRRKVAPMFELGPPVPLDGLSHKERAELRRQRIQKAAEEGVPLEALKERFGNCDEYSRLVDIESRLPLGVPA